MVTNLYFGIGETTHLSPIWLLKHNTDVIFWSARHGKEHDKIGTVCVSHVRNESAPGVTCNVI